MAEGREAYNVRPWVLWDRKDPLRAVHGRADLDAVIVETPYEHVRYDGYLQRLQGYPLGPKQIDAFRREADNHVGFVIYAHSRTGDDSEHGFLARFSNARLLLPSGAALAATQRVVFGPSADFYDVGTFRERRYTGSLTYRFAISAGSCPTNATLQFGDGDGRAYNFAPVGFSRYR
jgi:hypothetical protein